MKKIILIMLAMLLFGVLPATVSADAWTMNNTPTRFFASEFAHVNAAVSKFEGVLLAYSVNQKDDGCYQPGEDILDIASNKIGSVAVEKQIFAASDDLSTSLESLNVALNEIYPSLNKEQQLAVINAYLPSSVQLQIFGRLPDESSLLLLTPIHC